MMSRIYRAGERTIVWLGADQDNGLVLETHRDFSGEERLLGKSASGRDSPGLIVESWTDSWRRQADHTVELRTYLKTKLDSLNIARVSWLDSWRQTPDRSAGLQAVRNMLGVAYWKRHWIAQEVIMSTFVIVLYGDLEMRWPIVEDILTAFSWLDGCNTAATTLRDMKSLFSRGGSEIPLDTFYIYALKFACRSQCADLRDKVYGLQGVLAPDFHVKVDYTLLVSDISGIQSRSGSHKKQTMWLSVSFLLTSASLHMR
jgi:hypothetical protein